MNKRARSHSGRVHDFFVEIKEREAEHNETRSKEAAMALFKAQRKGSAEDFGRALDHSVGSIEDQNAERRDLLRRHNVKFTREEAS